MKIYIGLEISKYRGNEMYNYYYYWKHEGMTSALKHFMT